MTGNAVVIMVPSNWCMNWAQPTINGTMTEKRDEEAAIASGNAREAGGAQALLEHGQWHLLAWRREGAVERAQVSRAQPQVIGLAVRPDVLRPDRLGDRDNAFLL